jgi:hypothetical protein
MDSESWSVPMHARDPAPAHRGGRQQLPEGVVCADLACLVAMWATPEKILKAIGGLVDADDLEYSDIRQLNALRNNVHTRCNAALHGKEPLVADIRTIESINHCTRWLDRLLRVLGVGVVMYTCHARCAKHASEPCAQCVAQYLGVDEKRTPPPIWVCNMGRGDQCVYVLGGRSSGSGCV